MITTIILAGGVGSRVGAGRPKQFVYQAYGDQSNIKIKTKEDLDMFERYVLMKRRRESKS